MLGLVLAVITGTFKEAGSGTTSRVSPGQDLETEIISLEPQFANKLAGGINPQTTRASPALNSLDSQGEGHEPTSQLNCDDSDNGEVMLRLWAKVSC